MEKEREKEREIGRGKESETSPSKKSDQTWKRMREMEEDDWYSNEEQEKKVLVRKTELEKETGIRNQTRLERNW